MKITLLLLILAILMINPVLAAIEKDLYERESFEIIGHNITLMGIGNKEKSIIACVNNKIYIIDKDEKKEIENIKINPERIYEDHTRLQITYSGEGTCDESCSNNVCLGNVPKEEIDQEEQENESIKNQQTIQKDNTTVLSAGLFLLVLLLLIILLIKKKR